MAPGASFAAVTVGYWDFTSPFVPEPSHHQRGISWVSEWNQLSKVIAHVVDELKKITIYMCECVC